MTKKQAKSVAKGRFTQSQMRNLWLMRLFTELWHDGSRQPAHYEYDREGLIVAGASGLPPRNNGA